MDMDKFEKWHERMTVLLYVIILFSGSLMGMLLIAVFVNSFFFTGFSRPLTYEDWNILSIVVSLSIILFGYGIQMLKSYRKMKSK